MPMDCRGKFVLACAVLGFCCIERAVSVRSCDRETIRVFVRQCSHYLSKRSVDSNSIMGRLMGDQSNAISFEEPQDALEYEDVPVRRRNPVARHKIPEVVDEFLQQDIVARNGLFRRRSRNAVPRPRHPRGEVGASSHSCNLAALTELCSRKK